MPTDEQRMRNEFEEIRVAEYDILSVDRDPETGEYARRSTYEAWGNFIEGWLARDAEVQALRVQGYQLHRMVSFFASSIKSGEQWSAYHEEEMAALRAALAGGETGEAE